MLRLPNHWVWDSWVITDGPNHHAFYLKAPRDLVDPGLRHARATIGHAVSTDLVEWEILPDALGPTRSSWDDLATWTGSVVRDDDGTWWMFYTAINTRGHGLRDQRIGVARSDDLVAWHKQGDGPVVEVDTRWYKTLEDDPGASETWRDPKVVRDPHGDGWHMLITARALGHGEGDDAVIAHATSPDLHHWEVGPPLCEAGAGFGELEVPQVAIVDGAPIMVFSCHPDKMTRARRADDGEYCTWAVPGPSLLGPWDLTTARPFRREPRLFAAPLVRRVDGTWAMFGFVNHEPEALPPFDLIDPITVTVVDGELVAVDDLAS